MNEVENTARALREQPALVTGMFCRFNFHRWTKWSPVIRSPGSIYYRQERYCADCNKYEELKGKNL